MPVTAESMKTESATMTLKQRIYMLPLMAALIFGAVVVIVGWTAASTSEHIAAVGATSYPYLDASTRLKNEVESIVAAIQGAVAEGSEDRLAEARDRKAAADKLIDAIAALDGKAETGARLRALLEGYSKAATDTALIMLGKSQGDQPTAVAGMQKVHKMLADKLEATVSEARSGLDGGISDSRDGVWTIVLSIAGGALLVVVALGAGSWLLARSIWGQIGGEPEYARQMLAKMAGGDLSEAVTVRSGDTDSLLAALLGMSNGLSGIVSVVREGSDQMAVAAREIAGGNQDLSMRTEQQASALEETAASMEQLSATVKQNAENAQQANQLAQAASSMAIRGGEVVAEVVETMKNINDASKRIFDIIGVIDGIAFQTNILALNAAVEAARAGEQGRGFAVVASEVRSLAGRSADAAKEIKTLIGASVERVEQGSMLVDKAGVTMTEVVGGIRRVNDLMGEISVASREQSQGVSQVGEAVQQMDKVTQQNAALVEEMAAAASSLKSQAQDLVATVAEFKLDSDASNGGMARHEIGRGPRDIDSIERSALTFQSKPRVRQVALKLKP